MSHRLCIRYYTLTRLGNVEQPCPMQAMSLLLAPRAGKKLHGSERLGIADDEYVTSCLFWCHPIPHVFMHDTQRSLLTAAMVASLLYHGRSNRALSTGSPSTPPMSPWSRQTLRVLCGVTGALCLHTNRHDGGPRSRFRSCNGNFDVAVFP